MYYYTTNIYKKCLTYIVELRQLSETFLQCDSNKTFVLIKPNVIFSTNQHTNFTWYGAYILDQNWRICLELKLLLPDLLRIVLLESSDELYQILPRGVALVLPAQQKNDTID
jgi:hypothetical protein